MPKFDVPASALLALVLIVAASHCATADPADSNRAMTIYNQNFAVVRESVPMVLVPGVNHVSFNDITYHVEPDSVVLRDPDSKHTIKVLEQNYRADPISQGRLLALYEGQTIDFQVTTGDYTEIVQGKIVRSGYVPASNQEVYRYSPYGMQSIDNNASEPLIEVKGKLQFSLPGLPIFPALTDDSILKPTLDWSLVADRTGPVNAELNYVTEGLNWEAAYNIQAADDSDTVDLVGWVTIDNKSGKSFENAHIKLMAGDVKKVQNQGLEHSADEVMVVGGIVTRNGQQVAEQPFDEYHLYTLAQPATLRDRETKQVEFVRASGVQAKTIYVYDGYQYDPSMNYGYEDFIRQIQYGTLTNKKVLIVREIENTEANHLGMPIPKGKVRFYRQDGDGQLEFTG